MSGTYRVTPDNTRAPAVILRAGDAVTLGEQIVAHLIRHKLLRPGIKYDAQVWNEGGIFRQDHAPTVRVTIREESNR